MLMHKPHAAACVLFDVWSRVTSCDLVKVRCNMRSGVCIALWAMACGLSLRLLPQEALVMIAERRRLLFLLSSSVV